MTEEISFELDEGTLRCKAGGRFSWSIGLEEIVLIAEVRFGCSASEGGGDIILVQHGGKRLESFSANTGSARDILRRLGGVFGEELGSQLEDSGSLASVVMWPPSLKGKPLFTNLPGPRGGIFAWLKEFFSPPKGLYFSDSSVQRGSVAARTLLSIGRPLFW